MRMHMSLVATAGFLLAGPGEAAMTLFNDNYDISNWTLTTDSGDGSVVTALAPATITLIGSDSGQGIPVNTDFTVPVVDNGSFVFDWFYQTFDEPAWDPFGYLLNGVFFQLTDDLPAILTIQSGTHAVAVTVGDVFGFRIHSVDDQSGPA